MDNPVFTSLRYYTFLNNVLLRPIAAHSLQLYSVTLCGLGIVLWLKHTQTWHWWIDQVGGRCWRGGGNKNGISKLGYHFAGRKSNLRYHFSGQSRQRSSEVVRQAEDCFCDQCFISQIYPCLFIMETFYTLIKSRTTSAKDYTSILTMYVTLLFPMFPVWSRVESAGCNTNLPHAVKLPKMTLSGKSAGHNRDFFVLRAILQSLSKNWTFCKALKTFFSSHFSSYVQPKTILLQYKIVWADMWREENSLLTLRMS